jgi:hypothetical protein
MTFVDEYKKLVKNCPHPGFKQTMAENCEYTDFLEKGKNCYYVFDGGDVEDVYYCEWTGFAKDCADCSNVLNMELCYECVESQECYNCNFLLGCNGTRDSEFCFDCNNCKHCFLCSGLRHKEFFVMNEDVGEEGYFKKIIELKRKVFDELSSELEKISLPTPRVNLHLNHSENCVGDFVHYSSNVYCGFGVVNERDDFYVWDMGSFDGGVDNCDCFLGGDCQLCYECCYMTRSYNCNFVNRAERCADCEFCEECYGCKNCFGCTYLKDKQFYILNEKCEKEEYLKKVEEIKKGLKDAGKYCVDLIGD